MSIVRVAHGSDIQVLNETASVDVSIIEPFESFESFEPFDPDEPRLGDVRGTCKKVEHKKVKCPHAKNIKRSSGIACCRHNKGSLEILLVKKRYTYGFAAFVLGQYSRRDEKKLKMLFNGMTIQEKIEVLGLRFDMLWYKIWLEFPESNMAPSHFKHIKRSHREVWKSLYLQENSISPTARECGAVEDEMVSKSNLDLYIKRKNKFESMFVVDGGKRLRNLIAGTRNNELMWEIPKGRKKRHETFLDCSIREFKEETGGDLDSYNLMFDIRPVVEKYASLGTTYVHNYYVAYSSKDFQPVIDFNSIEQLSEVDSMRWIRLDEIKFIDNAGRLLKLVGDIFRVFKAKYKKSVV